MDFVLFGGGVFKVIFAAAIIVVIFVSQSESTQSVVEGKSMTT